MTFSVLLRTVVLAVLGAACVVAGGIKDMGPCKQYTGILKSFDFNYLVTKNGGKWHYQMVPDEPFFDNIKSASIKFTSAGANLADVQITNVMKSGGQQGFSSGRITYQGNGHAVSDSSTATTSGNNKYKYYYLSKGPKHVYYVVCSDQGANTNLDYRNVIVTKKLSDSEMQQVLKDDAYSFMGALRRLEVPE